MDIGYEIQRLDRKIQRLERKIQTCVAQMEELKRMQARIMNGPLQMTEGKMGSRDIPREDRQPPM